MSADLVRHTLLAAVLAVCAACTRPPATTLPTPEPSTPTPEVFIALTQVMPARIRLNDMECAVGAATLDVCDLPACPQLADGTRFLRVSLQALGPVDDAFDEAAPLPAGIAIHDDTGAITAFDQLHAYTPETQQLRLFFAVPAAASVFGLQWPGTTEIPLTLEPSAR